MRVPHRADSIDAELLTLRSEFEKSSATYDREIDGLMADVSGDVRGGVMRTSSPEEPSSRFATQVAEAGAEGGR